MQRVLLVALAMLAAQAGWGPSAWAQSTRDAEDRVARPGAPPLPAKPPLPPLQTEPGDIWAEVKGWQEQQRLRIERGGSALPTAPAPRKGAAQRPARPAVPVAPLAAPPG